METLPVDPLPLHGAPVAEGPADPGTGRHWLFWDRDCGLCARSVAWVVRQDGGGRFRAVPYQQAPSPPMTPELRQACSHAVHVLTADGRRLRAGRACLFVLREIGRFRGLARLFSWPPWIWFVELGYRIVATHRNFFSRILFRGEEGPAACDLGGKD